MLSFKNFSQKVTLLGSLIIIKQQQNFLLAPKFNFYGFSDGVLTESLNIIGGYVH